MRADALIRSSSLLVADYLVIGLIGGICSVIAARSWSPHDVGAVAGVTGAVALIVTASSVGVGSTITRFLGSEPNQRRFVLEAIALSVGVGLLLVAVLCFSPGHFGVPLHNLRVNDVAVFGLIGGYVTSSVLVAVTDPAFLSRKEVSFSVAKDIASSVVRIGILIALIGTTAVGLFGASVGYVATSAIIDVGLIFWRLRDRAARTPFFMLRMMRSRVRFAAGSHVAALVAVIPGSLLVTVVAARFGATPAAFVGVPLTVAAYVTIIPSMTSQALLAELSGESIDVVRLAVRALRLSYTGTLPAATLLVIVAPYILLIYGHDYSLHGSWFLRWGAAAAVFSTFNYVGDIVLLARQKVVAYNVVNMLGTVAILGCVFVAVGLGLRWVGPAWFAGQAIYACVSVTTLLRYGKLSEVMAACRGLTWRPRRI